MEVTSDEPPEGSISDRVPRDVRAAEHEVDREFLKNALTRLTFSEACWYYLAVVEDRTSTTIANSYARRTLDERALADHLVVHSKVPVAWLKSACRKGGQVPHSVKWDLCQAAQELQDLAEQYFSFETAFTWATLGHAELSILDSLIRVSGPIIEDARIDAYDRIVDSQAKHASPSASTGQLARWLGQVSVKEDRFQYRLTRQDARALRDEIAPEFASRFALPSEWQFGAFSLGQFAEVAKTLWTICYCHHAARAAALSKGATDRALLSSVIVTSSRALRRRLADLSGVDSEAVDAVVECLTYGAASQKTPDPALQPIIHLGSNVVLPPAIVASSALERNMAVLLNRIPEFRTTYAARSVAREAILRQELTEEFQACGLRVWHGAIPSWGVAQEIDLVAIDDERRVALMLELKAFVGPAEPREILDRSREIARGVEQVHRRRLMATQQRSAADARLAIASDYRLSLAVASKTSIGTAMVQDNAVAVVNSAHLAARVRRAGLPATVDWLEKRAYLPVDGVHYRRHAVTARVGGWGIEWYKIQVLDGGGLLSA